MTKRNKVRIASFSTAILMALTGMLVEYNFMLNDSKRELEYTYRRSLNDLTDYVSDMEYSLKKSGYANTPTMRGQISSELLEKSSGAKAAMATLPFSDEKSEKISRFISQVGDYAMSLSRKTAAGEEITDEEFQNLLYMEEYAYKLSQGFKEMQEYLSTQRAEIGSTRRVLSNVTDVEDIPSFDDNLDEVSKEFAQFPSLLYDGPFSDHIMKRDPEMIKGEKEISQKEAKNKAADFLDCPVDKLNNGGNVENSIPSYVFLYNDTRISITKKGGFVSYLKKSGDIPQSSIDYDEAVKHAQLFLKMAGITSVKESYYVMNDNSCTINFSYLSEDGKDIICYPDLLKVVVNMSNGDIIEYDPSGYLMNHKERDAKEPKLSLEEAKGNVSTNLSIKDYEMAFIPTPGLDETYCYEFKCVDKRGTEVLVYINTQTGMEDQIFILTYSDNGVLTF